MHRTNGAGASRTAERAPRGGRLARWLSPRTREVVHRGVDAAVLASIPQVLVPKIEERLFLRRRESADLGPRFIEALAGRMKQRLPEDTKWLAASAFHFGYAAFWGAAYALVYERRPVRPWVGGLSLATLIHLITFPRWGAAVLSGTEEHPRDRPWRMEAVLVTAPLVFGLGTALIYGRGPARIAPMPAPTALLTPATVVPSTPPTTGRSEWQTET